MTCPFTIDLDSPDYRPAVTALERAFVNARRLKFTLPTGFEMALQLLKDEAKVIMFLSSPKGGFFSVVEAGEDADEQDFDDFLELMKKRAERRRERRQQGSQAAQAIASFARAIGADHPPSDAERTLPIMPRQKGGLVRASQKAQTDAS